MAKKLDRGRVKGRSGKASPFLMIPRKVLDSHRYINLDHTAKTLLLDVFRQYNGFNNGDFCTTLKVLKARGWNSYSTLKKAQDQLLDAGLIIQTRQGQKRMCNLFAVTWLNIDECNGKLDVKPTKVPIDLFN